MTNYRILFALLLVATFAFLVEGSSDFPKTLIGKVVSVADGDTITILDVDKNQIRVRLAGIDAPETKQAYSAKSKAAIVNAIKGKQVRIEWKTRDRYKRIIGHVYLGKQWINHSQVMKGWAWHYKKYSKDKRLDAAEVSARKEKRGLWAEPSDPVPPWQFRKSKKKDSLKKSHQLPTK